MIYTNPFARYDASEMETPYTVPSHTVNIPVDIFQLMLLVLYSTYSSIMMYATYV